MCVHSSIRAFFNFLIHRTCNGTRTQQFTIVCGSLRSPFDAFHAVARIRQRCVHPTRCSVDLMSTRGPRFTVVPVVRILPRVGWTGHTIAVVQRCTVAGQPVRVTVRSGICFVGTCCGPIPVAVCTRWALGARRYAFRTLKCVGRRLFPIAINHLTISKPTKWVSK